MDSVTPIRKIPPDGLLGAPCRTTVKVSLGRLGPALDAIAQSRRVAVSVLVREAVVEWMSAHPTAGDAGAADGDDLDAPLPRESEAAVVIMRFQVPARQANSLVRMARAAALSRGAYVARLLDGVPPAPMPPDLTGCRADLVRSAATLAALSGDLREFARTLRQHPSPDLMPCVGTISQLCEALSQHLAIAAPLIAALKPFRRARADDST